jgi:hypothetical protein
MRVIRRYLPKGNSLLLLLGGIVLLSASLIMLESCGNSGSAMVSNGTGTIHVSLTDPPSCAFPNGNFDHVYVTINSVQANINATADDSSSGWQELAPQLNTQPLQIDLFAAGSNACLLSELGSNTGLPAGSYQQIRLLLVPNDGGTGPVPATNACGKQGFNCVVLHDGTVDELQLSSQANTGLKIPPGQIVGGPIVVNPGQDIDLNIDFNACASIVQEGNGQFRLKPVLTAGQVSPNSSGISGQVVDGATGLPVVGGTVLVALEQQDGSGTAQFSWRKRRTPAATSTSARCRRAQHLTSWPWPSMAQELLTTRPSESAYQAAQISERFRSQLKRVRPLAQQR